MKKIYILLAVLALLLTGFLIFRGDNVVEVSGTGYLNTTYKVDGKEVRLVNGKSEEVVLGSSSKIVTQYFGNEVKSDLDDDGREDIAFILTQQAGGSGTFYYVVAALNKDSGYVGSDGYLLGDRIAPQTTELSRNSRHKNVIVVNYADRNAGEPMTTKPSMGKSAYLKLDPERMQWGIVAPDFEGEANSSVMSLNMQTWTWVNTVYGDDKEVKPLGTKPFTLTINKDKSFSATTDCNGVGGEYVLKDGNQILFTKMMSTLMYCENSQEAEFTKMLGEVQSYYFTNKGELVFNLKFDSGLMIFR